MFYLAELVLTLDHFHTKSIIYRDLKGRDLKAPHTAAPAPTACQLQPRGGVHWAMAQMCRRPAAENVMLGPAGHIMLIDFGVAQMKARAKGQEGTPHIMAPEVVNRACSTHGPTSCPPSPSAHDEEEESDNGYTDAADIWSLGVLAFEMLGGVSSSPFNKGASDCRRAPLCPPHPHRRRAARRITVASPSGDDIQATFQAIQTAEIKPLIAALGADRRKYFEDEPDELADRAVGVVTRMLQARPPTASPAALGHEWHVDGRPPQPLTQPIGAQRDPGKRSTAAALKSDKFFLEAGDGGGLLFDWVELAAKTVQPPFAPNTTRWVKNFSPGPSVVCV